MAIQERISFDYDRYRRGYYRANAAGGSWEARKQAGEYRWRVREEVECAKDKIFDAQLRGIKDRLASLTVALVLTSLFAPLPATDAAFIADGLNPGPTTADAQAVLFDHQVQRRREKLVEIDDGKTKKKISPDHTPDRKNLPQVLKTRKNGFPKGGGISGHYPG